MSTTDIAPETVADVPTGSAADEVTGSALASRRLVVHVERLQGHRAQLHRLLAARPRRRRRPRRDPRCRAHRRRRRPHRRGIAAAAVRRLPHRPRLRCPRPAPPRPRRRRRPAAGRRPVARLPPPGRCRLLGVAHRPRPRVRRAGQQRWSRRRRRGHGRPVHRRPRPPRHRARRGLGDRRGDRADHARAGDADGPAAAVRLVGADRLDRFPARAAGPASAWSSTCSSTTATTAPSSAATPASARGSASPSPNLSPTCSPCRPSASSPTCCPSRSASARRLRGVAYAGLAIIGVAALSGVTQQINHDLPWAGSGVDLDGFADKVSDLIPYLLFTLVPLLGVVIVMFVGALDRPPAERPRDVGPPEASRRRSCSPSSASG